MLRDMAYGDREIGFNIHADRYCVVQIHDIEARTGGRGGEAEVNAEFATLLKAIALFDAINNGGLSAYRASHRGDPGLVLAASY